MSRVRALDSSHDWLFGKGQNDYKRNNAAVIQNIDTRLNAYLGDCFFDSGAGIDWFNLLGAKDLLALKLAVAAVILNTQDVTGLLDLSISLSVARELSLSYRAATTYSVVSSSFVLDPNGTA